MHTATERSETNYRRIDVLEISTWVCGSNSNSNCRDNETEWAIIGLIMWRFWPFCGFRRGRKYQQNGLILIIKKALKLVNWIIASTYVCAIYFYKQLSRRIGKGIRFVRFWIIIRFHEDFQYDGVKFSIDRNAIIYVRY